jgi:hypothetical protein
MLALSVLAEPAPRPVNRYVAIGMFEVTVCEPSLSRQAVSPVAMPFISASMRDAVMKWFGAPLARSVAQLYKRENVPLLNAIIFVLQT